MIADLGMPHLAREDWYGHAEAGFVIGMVTHGLVEDFLPHAPKPVKVLLKLAAPVAAGIGKELYDRHNHGDCDWRDAAATAGGGVLAISLHVRF